MRSSVVVCKGSPGLPFSFSLSNDPEGDAPHSACYYPLCVIIHRLPDFKKGSGNPGFKCEFVELIHNEY